MKILIYTFFVIFYAAITLHGQAPKRSVSNKSYREVLKEVDGLRKSLRKKYLSKKTKQEKNIFLDTVMIEFSNTLVHRIIPYWYGTKWDFDGHTSKPKEGKIACGYFLSTTLRDMGLVINRYTLAQQSPISEALTIALEKTYFTDITFELFASNNTVVKRIKRLGKGLYFAGIGDNHVGYLYITKEGIFLIDSNCIHEKVTFEEIEKSIAFLDRKYYIAEITGNHSLALKWLFKRKITVIRDSLTVTVPFLESF